MDRVRFYRIYYAVGYGGCLHIDGRASPVVTLQHDLPWCYFWRWTYYPLQCVFLVLVIPNHDHQPSYHYTSLESTVSNPTIQH